MLWANGCDILYPQLLLPFLEYWVPYDCAAMQTSVPVNSREARKRGPLICLLLCSQSWYEDWKTVLPRRPNKGSRESQGFKGSTWGPQIHSQSIETYYLCVCVLCLLLFYSLSWLFYKHLFTHIIYIFKYSILTSISFSTPILFFQPPFKWVISVVSI